MQPSREKKTIRVGPLFARVGSPIFALNVVRDSGSPMCGVTTVNKQVAILVYFKRWDKLTFAPGIPMLMVLPMTQL